LPSLREKLNAEQFVFTAEVTPPLSCNPDDLRERAAPLQGLADAVNVTDGAGARAHLDATVAAHLLREQGLEPILQFTGRDRNRIALQSELVGAAALGIVNVLALTGDDPKAGDQPEAKPVFDLDSIGIVETAAAIRDTHQLPYGRTVGGRADFFIGVADSPLDPSDAWEPEALRRKIEAGAEFTQTQFCMDVQVLRRYLERLREHDIAKNFYILVGVAPLASARSALWIRNTLRGSLIPDWIVARLENASDPKAEGETICVDVIREVREIEGIAGVHIMAPLNHAAIPRVIARARG
jgi:methylenetetrahydrofolate reductase (NADPH)